MLSDLQVKVNEFILKYDQEISLTARVLDIASEVGEIAAEFIYTPFAPPDISSELQKKLEEEIGDVGFAVLCLATQVGVNVHSIEESSYLNVLKEHRFSPESHFNALCAQVGKVAKALLKLTSYGKQEPEIISEKLIQEAEILLSHLLSFSDDYNIDLFNAVNIVLKKYERRFEKGKTIGSESET
jgi:NTP pyrophosphatase (non-canonical NTP hydrolase)